MKRNITSGQELNRILEGLYPDEIFIPFNEAMITGSYSAELFSDAFIAERAKVHEVSEESYRNTMKPFLDLLAQLSDVNELVLWFGDEPFCRENRKALLQTLSERGFSGRLLLNIVNEESGQILTQEEYKADSL